MYTAKLLTVVFRMSGEGWVFRGMRPISSQVSSVFCRSLMTSEQLPSVLGKKFVLGRKRQGEGRRIASCRRRFSSDVKEVDLEAQVMIVGAGPVGMYLSLLLSRYGVSSLVVDRGERGGDHGLGEEQRPHPRAHVLNTRTMEIMREVGLDR